MELPDNPRLREVFWVYDYLSRPLEQAEISVRNGEVGMGAFSWLQELKSDEVLARKFRNEIYPKFLLRLDTKEKSVRRSEESSGKVSYEKMLKMFEKSYKESRRGAGV